MKAQTEIQFATRHAVNITDETFKRIEEWFGDGQATIEVRAKCSDDAVRTFTRIPDFMEYGNESDRRIERLSIDATLKDETATANVTIGDSAGQSEFSKTAVVLRGSDVFCEDGRSFLKREIGRWRPWYWSLVHMPFGIANAIVFFMLGGVLVEDSLNANWAEQGPGSEYQARLIIAVLVLSAIGGVFGRIIGKRLFPTVVFSIGDGMERYKHLDRMRYLTISLFAGLVLTVALAAT